MNVFERLFNVLANLLAWESSGFSGQEAWRWLHIHNDWEYHAFSVLHYFVYGTNWT